MMGRRSVLACLAAICGCLCLLLFWKDDETKELDFSKASGFYDEPFELVLSAPAGTEIYYTLDGTDPVEHGTKYTEPILIDDATQHDNVHCMRTDVSVEFVSDGIETYNYEPEYVLPDYPIDKCTVVRAAYRDTDGNFGVVETESYFVGYDSKAGYDGMNIMSIVTDPDNLFDYDTGIYVLGRIFDEYEGAKYAMGHLWNTNYAQSGIDWERPATIQIFDRDGDMLLNQDCGIRIQGGMNRLKTPKSMNLYSRDEYDNMGRFYVDLFGTGYMADTVTLFAGGDDTLTKSQDAIVSGLVADRSFAAMHYEPYVMFLDGEYWGVYWLTEKYNDVYLKERYGIDKKDAVIIKHGAIAEGLEEDISLYTDMMTYMENTDLSLPENYAYVCELIDMQSYIDYYAAEIYIGRYSDWPVNNEALWRTREVRDGEYEDGRWRWLLFDVDGLALSSDITQMDTMANTMERSAMFRNLCQNEAFKRQFATTFMDLANTAFERGHVDAVVSEYIDFMSEPMGVHLKRFFGAEDIDLFLDAMADIQSFLDGRRSYIVQYVKDGLGLTGTLAPVTLEVSDAAAGSVVLNTIEPAFNENGRWRGEYFTDYPVALTATANEGYRFVGWESDVSPDEWTVDNETVAVPVKGGGVWVKAVFEKVE